MVPALKVAVARLTCLDVFGAGVVVFDTLSYRHVVMGQRAKGRVRRRYPFTGMTDITVSCRGKVHRNDARS